MTDEQLHAHLIGQQGSRRSLNTPVLILDIDALGRNIAAMATFVGLNGLALRPHSKTHKSPEIAMRQIAAGAVGICCAKIGEAEVMADNGVADGLLITSPVVSPPAVQRLVCLNTRTTDLMCVVDNVSNVEAIATANADGNKAIDLLIDIDPGIHRTGVGSPAAALAVLDAIRSFPSLRYSGVQCYCGAEQHIEDFEERRSSMDSRAAMIAEIVAALTAVGGEPGIVTGGGTGTHRIDAEQGVFTELQAGSYVFMDDQYLACDLTGLGDSPPFDAALMVDARVVSANTPGLATLDAGFKALSTDAGNPSIRNGAPGGSAFRFMGDEHGALILRDRSNLQISTLVTIGVPHCDPTVNLYDNYHVVSGDTLQALWPVIGRGRSR